MTATRTTFLMSVALCAALAAGCGKKDDAIAKAEKKDAEKPGVVAIKDTVREAYIYGFPMLMNYGVMSARRNGTSGRTPGARLPTPRAR